MTIDPHSDPADEGAHRDSMAPPEQPIMVHCIECGREYMSTEIWFEPVPSAERGTSTLEGFWRCPTPNCGGAGFCFDIYPADGSNPEGVDGGWFDDDGNPSLPPWLMPDDE